MSISPPPTLVIWPSLIDVCWGNTSPDCCTTALWSRRAFCARSHETRTGGGGKRRIFWSRIYLEIYIMYIVTSVRKRYNIDSFRYLSINAVFFEPNWRFDCPTLTPPPPTRRYSSKTRGPSWKGCIQCNGLRLSLSSYTAQLRVSVSLFIMGKWS